MNKLLEYRAAVLEHEARGRVLDKEIELAKLRAEEEDKFCDNNCVWTDHHIDCVRAAPSVAQREWASLTDEEVQKIVLDSDTFIDAISFAESLLKEKNNAD